MPQSSNKVTRASPLKNKAERIEEMILIHVCLSGTKTLPYTNLYFLDSVFYLNSDKMTICTGSKHVL
jgi:hypothetical protein